MANAPRPRSWLPWAIAGLGDGQFFHRVVVVETSDPARNVVHLVVFEH